MSKPLQGPLTSQRLLATLKAANRPWALEPHGSYGFTLVELLLALGLGLLVAAWFIEVLLAQGNLSAKLVDRLHHREFERRARRLIEDDRRLASLAASQPGAEGTACNLAGRQPLLQLHLPAGKPPITWSLGSAPSSIWRGQVLMRCGPAYGLDGQPSLTGSWQNRVVLDLAEGFEIPL
ncbi:prepilin-type cleavage/methylation domain-containing protein [Synechococcus sp. UW140]|uniref:prepilin-type cleavage/methylation domain-containing protein n=1 Tax=Synechococcus sp. UW140 TaxID=368503 RepID=UPI0025F4A1FF|nr:prepilin-type cleavage/methylation domain-containing protein [Synechococcus sp. UW140]